MLFNRLALGKIFDKRFFGLALTHITLSLAYIIHSYALITFVKFQLKLSKDHIWRNLVEYLCVDLGMSEIAFNIHYLYQFLLPIFTGFVAVEYLRYKRQLMVNMASRSSCKLILHRQLAWYIAIKYTLAIFLSYLFMYLLMALFMQPGSPDNIPPQFLLDIVSFDFIRNQYPLYLIIRDTFTYFFVPLGFFYQAANLALWAKNQVEGFLFPVFWLMGGTLISQYLLGALPLPGWQTYFYYFGPLIVIAPDAIPHHTSTLGIMLALLVPVSLLSALSIYFRCKKHADFLSINV